MNECLDEQTILAFGRGQIAPEKRRPIEKHMATCDECRALVSAVARSSFVDPRELMGASPSETSEAVPVAPPAPQKPDARASVSVGLGGRPKGPEAKLAGGTPADAAPSFDGLRSSSAPRAPAPPVIDEPQSDRLGRPFDKRIAIGIVLLLALLLAAAAIVTARRGI